MSSVEVDALKEATIRRFVEAYNSSPLVNVGPNDTREICKDDVEIGVMFAYGDGYLFTLRALGAVATYMSVMGTETCISSIPVLSEREGGAT